MLLKRQRETKPMAYQHKHRAIGSDYNFLYLEGLAGSLHLHDNKAPLFSCDISSTVRAFLLLPPPTCLFPLHTEVLSSNSLCHEWQHLRDLLQFKGSILVQLHKMPFL